MKNATIEELAYILREAKKNNQDRAIFFIGAGASQSGGIPLASEIVKDILARYQDNPRINNLGEDKRNDYASLMDCLTPFQRNALLKEYIDKAKVNVTHIYLALLAKHDFIDYVLTVNFDNLMLRALSLFNKFPPSYDMAILKDLTTTKFKEKSVVYLHGQHHGLWLLNTPEEMEKVKETVPRIFDSIKSGRPWIFLGYSGNDPIFDHVKNLGRFDNGLYWITYKDNNPIEEVSKFLEKQNTNASLIKGYDADSFMLKLNTELDLGQPEIIDKPFSSLKGLLDNIVDIEEEEHFKGVKQRLDIAHSQVDAAIKQFEKGKISKTSLKKSSKIDLLKKDIINLIAEENYSYPNFSILESDAKKQNDNAVNELLSIYYNNWGTHLTGLSKNKEVKEAEDLHQQAFEKFQKATSIDSDNEIFYNWGNSLGDLAKIKEGKEAEDLYKQAFEKFQKAISIKPDMHEAFNNWGNYLADLAKIKEGKEAEDLYEQAFDKFQKAISINPDDRDTFYNWGTAITDLANIKGGKEAEGLYLQAFDKFQKAISINPDDFKAFYNWGTSLVDLAKSKTGKEAEELFQQAFDKFQKAISKKPDMHEAFYNWGTALGNTAKLKEGKEADDLYLQAFDKFQKAISIKPDKHEAFYNWGTYLGYLAKLKEGKKADDLYLQAFDKFQKAISIKPDKHEAFNNWGNALLELAKLKEGKEADDLYKQAFEKLNKSIELGGDFYNLSCYYALISDKENAFLYLDKSLSKGEVTSQFVKDDKDWERFYSDPDFINLIKKYDKRK